MLTIGLTGGIGSGKSAASAMFAELGAAIVDADVVSREVVRPGEPALQQIAAHFGTDILLEDGTLNRRALREVIFTDPAEKAWLEQLLHPLINRRIREQLEQAQAPYALLVSPLLLETEQHQLVDRVLVVDCEPALQISRVLARDGASEEQARAIMAAQVDAESRRKRADIVVDNNGDLGHLRAQVLRAHEKFLRLAGQSAAK